MVRGAPLDAFTDYISPVYLNLSLVADNSTLSLAPLPLPNSHILPILLILPLLLPHQC